LTRLPNNLTPVIELDPETIPNQRLPSFLGPDRLAELGLDLSAAIEPACEWLTTWWTAAVLSERPDAPVDLSITVLKKSFRDWCLACSCSWPLMRAPSEFAESVLSPLMIDVLESADETGGD
jgi:hypothetical protein